MPVGEPALQAIALRLPDEPRWALAQQALAEIEDDELRALPLADLAMGWSELDGVVIEDGGRLRTTLAGDLEWVMRVLPDQDPHLVVLRPQGDERILVCAQWTTIDGLSGLPAAVARLNEAGVLRAAGMVPVAVLGYRP